MPSLVSEFWNHPKTQRASDVRNIALYVFAIVVLAITWSGVKSIQKNFELQKKIATLQQQNVVTGLQNENIRLQNEYYKTDQYLDLAARQQLGLAAPGESVLLIPARVSDRYVDSRIIPPALPQVSSSNNQAGYIKNIESWRDFLFGHKLISG